MDWKTNRFYPNGRSRKAKATVPDLEGVLMPENELERVLLACEEFQEGLFWGSPRFGHPEGEVWKHIREVLDNIDRIDRLSTLERERLRLIAFTHDTFKHKEDKSYPRDWSRHHAVYARRYLEKHTEDQAVLTITELHDEAFYCWRARHLFNQPAAGEERLEQLLQRLGGFRQLYYYFFWCDTRTGDKNPAPLHWFEDYVKGLQLLPRHQ